MNRSGAYGGVSLGGSLSSRPPDVQSEGVSWQFPLVPPYVTSALPAAPRGALEVLEKASEATVGDTEERGSSYALPRILPPAARASDALFLCLQNG